MTFRMGLLEQCTSRCSPKPAVLAATVVAVEELVVQVVEVRLVVEFRDPREAVPDIRG